MKDFNEKTFDGCSTFLKKIIDQTTSYKSMTFSEFVPDNTALIVVDVVNGFIREGAMASSQIATIIPEIVSLIKKCNSKEIPIVAFADTHRPDSIEFNSFPPHCIKDTSEAELVDEIKKAGGYIKIDKGSTNGFHENVFQQCLITNPQTNTLIVTGDCTDICVLQLCLTLQTWYTSKNKKVKIIVPLNCVETYDSPDHNSDFMNAVAIKLLSDSGITIVKEIK